MTSMKGKQFKAHYKAFFFRIGYAKVFGSGKSCNSSCTAHEDKIRSRCIPCQSKLFYQHGVYPRGNQARTCDKYELLNVLNLKPASFMAFLLASTVRGNPISP